MNQIIYVKNNRKNIMIYTLMFLFSFLMLFVVAFYYVLQYFNVLQKNKMSQRILSTYDIQQLYASIDNTVELPHIISDSGRIADIIGIIEISKINLRYPIISETSDEFLQIAPCKFSGPNINTYGNFCIAGHNFDNGMFFSNLFLLNINDIIDIYNLNRNKNLI